MKGFKIENGDIVKVKGRSVVLEDLEYYAQRIKHAIRLSLGESVYEPLTGMDWFTIFSTKIPRERVVIEIKKILLKDPETISIEKIEVIETNDSSRKIYIQYSANTKFGTVVEEI
ncbi:hypothetical protein A0128_05880 [Leptospira tipperaryensis]|uniref:DUF2634 domain-containing protein n=1 Tax=Leptospira tipperaryensis TaxID=2564040 RepID=A0A1D7UV45_9LEPT|nr:DUF2634 domain-containing protein [Leptospira tipperaryensis]AOP33414.1 hypothetical protein A0128_05880 [Leptospira tipperaryensis]